MKEKRLASAGLLAFAALAVIPLLKACALSDKLPGKNARENPTVDPDDGRRIDGDDDRVKEDVVTYANYCKQELGLPEAPLAPWNCLEGAEIPVTVDGKAPDAATYKDLAAHKVGCDLPSWLSEEPCANYAFVQKRTLAPNVEAILLCRMRSYSLADGAKARRATLTQNPTLDTFKSYYNFDSLGLIWTNTKTGKTCFFDVLGQTYGGRVPSPDDDRKPTLADLPEPKPQAAIGEGTVQQSQWLRDSRATWRSPTDVVKVDNCVRCHDSGPFKASPWIEQAFDVPANPQDVPYTVVGALFEDWRKRFPTEAISTAPIKNAAGLDEPQVCTSCHRIGAHATCDDYLEYSTGKTSPSQLSKRGASFFYRTWMPPPPAAWHGKSETELTTLWTDSYERHVARLKCCCQSPTARGCLVQDFGQAPLGAPRAGQGPGICP